MTQRILLRIRSDMHATQWQLLLLWLLLLMLLLLLLLLLMSGALNETTAFNVLENCKKNLSYTKTNTLRLHFVTDCCWLPSPVTRFPTPTGLPAHLAAAVAVVCAWGRQNNFTMLTHFMFIKSADRADWIEPNWTELDCPARAQDSTGHSADPPECPPRSSLPRVPSKSEPQFVHASFD